MGKKDKKGDKEKLEAKKLRQAAKQTKTTTKRVKKEIKESGEDDIEAIIAEFSAKDAARIAVTITPCVQPGPRANFSMTALPNGDMLLFGGEFCDGENTEVYNSLYRWNMEKNEWKNIESLNTPPPRCSHQAVYYKDKLYIFGGEYATLDQFHHYRDFWELDLKTSTWTEIKATGDAPNARSGHRMVVWRNFLVLFGGFYEAMREVRWFNDLYLYSFQDHRWISVPHKANTQVPKPRSGFQMCVHSMEDSVYVYGGYSKEKVTGSKKEGKVHEDNWCLNLKPILAAAGAGKGTGGVSSIDISKATWQKITRKGDFPSVRCGAGMTMYKNKALLFGGVFDDEGPRHSLISTFYNDLFAFDMERRRWYKLGLKQKKLKLKLSAADKKARKLLKQQSKSKGGEEEGDSDGQGNREDSDESGSEDDEDEDDVDGNDHSAVDAAGANKKGDFFGYIDESGTVVYIDMNEEDPSESTSADPAESSTQKLSGDELLSVADIAVDVQSMDIGSDSTPLVVESVVDASETTSKYEKRMAETLRNQEKYQSKGGRYKEMLDNSLQQEEDERSAEEVAAAGAQDAQIAATQSYVAKYFSEQTEPCTRINPCMVIRGNSLFIYGGVTELGDIEVTLDDCWSLDLNKRDNWKKVLPGTMHTLVWKGVEDDDCASSHYSSVNGSEDEDDSDDDDDDSDDDSEEDEEAHKKSSHKRSAKKISADEEEEGGGRRGKESSKSKSKGGGSGSKGGLRAEMEGLRSHFDMTDSTRTPLGEETLRQFYSRTTDHWAKEVIAQWHAKQEQQIADGTLNKNETLSEKEIKRQGFLLAEVRYNELLPLLARLNELETQQREEEEYSSRHDRGGSKGKSGGGKSSSSKNR